MLLLLSGCVSSGYETEVWDDGPEGGRVLVTEHYRLHVTTRDAEFNETLARTMERAHGHFERFAPTEVGADARPLEAYVFERKDDWADFTRRTATPAEVTTLLKPGLRGYARDDLFAVYRRGDVQTLTTARHEAWHQYVDARFATRPPPFLEEGLATLFEQGFEAGDATRPRTNAGRLRELRKAIRRRRAWPLGTLLRMHAGHVAGTDGRQIETFYAQAWALASFLAERHPRALRDLLAAYAAGLAPPDPRAALAAFVEAPFDAVQAEYESYCRALIAVPGDAK